MQAMLSDQQGRTLIVEPGIGWREGDGRYSLITNYSILAPESTMPFLVPGDDRGIWATRVSFVYSAKEHAVYYVENNHFSLIERYEFS